MNVLDSIPGQDNCLKQKDVLIVFMDIIGLEENSLGDTLLLAVHGI